MYYTNISLSFVLPQRNSFEILLVFFSIKSVLLLLLNTCCRSLYFCSSRYICIRKQVVARVVRLHLRRRHLYEIFPPLIIRIPIINCMCIVCMIGCRVPRRVQCSIFFFFFLRAMRVYTKNCFEDVYISSGADDIKGLLKISRKVY